MGVARWEREQQEMAAKKEAVRIAKVARVKLSGAQAEAEAHLAIIKAEVEARNAEIALLDLETAVASELRASDKVVLGKLRHGDEDGARPKRKPAKRAAKKKTV
jgi:hypothetical protein